MESTSNKPDQKRPKIEITPEMIEAGVEASYDLVSIEGLEVGRHFLVEEICRAVLNQHISS